MYVVAWKRQSVSNKEHYEVETIDEFINSISGIMKNSYLQEQPECSEDNIKATHTNLSISSDIKFVGISLKDADYVFLDYRYYKEVNEKEYYDTMI